MKNPYTFLKAKFLEYKKIQSAQVDKELKSYWIRSWLAYSMVYPLLRVFMNKKSAIALCEKIRPVPRPQEREGIMLKERADFDIFIEMFLRNVYKLEMLKPDMVVVDVGAHIGIYSVLAAKRAAKVITIEPSAKNYEQLKGNTARLQNVTTKNIALSNHQGMASFYLSEFSFSHSLNGEIVAESGSYTKTEVPVTTLDTLLKELQVEKVDVIKIDAEGEELNILKGAEETLKRNPHCQIIAASYHYPREREEVVHFLSERGFKVAEDEIDIIITG